MGIKELWSILTPYCERKPISELQGKIVAIDLSGWVCESMNVVDYFVHPRQYLKNLFFRTCYLLMEGVVPVFVLEGTAPNLKQKVIAKRNELQFRGVKPKEPKEQTCQVSKKDSKGRTRFNHVLKQCEILLNCMGIQCVQGPGEAEAYCAFLNKHGLVDGIISQDSDCFAYGAMRVYRNFSVSTQGKSAAQGGSVDIYDMKKICRNMDLGQEKIIVMALLCGCDYSEGISGVGKDSVLKLFKKYDNNEIIERIKSWRDTDAKYSALEMKVDDKNICSNCGHLGKTITHTKSGCSTCSTPKGCDESLWKEERLSIKAELMLRKKALSDKEFPSQKIIDEFLFEPSNLPKLNLNWKQPNIVKFLKQIGNLLQWPELYSFQKFLPLLTRWQIVSNNKHEIFTANVLPEFIHKKRVLKGTPSYEIVWKDEMQFFDTLIPESQLKTYIDDNPQGIQLLWTTIEPADMTEISYPELVDNFLKSIEKPIKPKKYRKKNALNKNPSLNNMNNLIRVTEEISKKLITGTKSKPRKGLQLIDKFFNKENIINHSNPRKNNCSTPIKKFSLSDLELDVDEDEENNNLSEIINGIVSRPKQAQLNYHAGKMLIYNQVNLNMSLNATQDDLALLPKKRNLSSFLICQIPKRASLSDSIKNVQKSRSIDDIVVIESDNEDNSKMLNHLDRFLINNSLKQENRTNTDQNKSYFFGTNGDCSEDEFEKSLDISFLKHEFKD